jgi:uncharacterized protein (DUF58 family)
MLTIRSSLILASATLMLIFSLVERNEPAALLALTALIWFWFEWLSFQRIALTTKPVVQGCRRFIAEQPEKQVTMVADRPFAVRLTGVLSPAVHGYRVIVHDTVPDTFEVIDDPFQILDSGTSTKFGFEYSTSTAICGKVSFPGLRVEISDYWGLFRIEKFVVLEQEPMVLPYLIRPQTTVSVLKHNNLQRHIGHHRHKSAGVSSELMGIRDYRVGDPPRTIAWKPTARLGKLMTCEFENEVPVRATILVDLAAYQFQGRPGPSSADRAIMACASIAKLLLADRDPVAAMLLKPEGAQRIDHGSGERQLTRLLQYLMVASNPNPPLNHFEIEPLIQLVFDNCSRRFPHLFDETFNHGPTRRRTYRIKPSRKDHVRRSLAVVLEALLNLEAGHSTRMQFDDDAMRKACLMYINQHPVVASSTNVTLNPPWSDPSRWYRECQRMTMLMTDMLMESKSRAKDNELFIVVAPEPFDQDCELAIESALKTVVAAGHRVIFIAPMVPYVPPVVQDPVAARILANADLGHSRDADSDFRSKLLGLGAAFSRVDDPKLMQIVAMEVGLLQSGKSRTRIMRSR